MYNFITHSLVQLSKKTISFLLIVSLLSVQTLWANETEEDLVRSRYVAATKMQINEFKGFLEDPSVGSRQLEDILREMEGGLSEAQKEDIKRWAHFSDNFRNVFLGNKELNPEDKVEITRNKQIDELLEDDDFTGLLFLLAKSQKWQEMKRDFEFEPPILTYMLGALCIGQMMSVYFLVDALRKSFIKPFTLLDEEPPSDLSFFTILLFEPVVACALCLPVLIYNVAFLGSDYVHQHQHSPIKPKAPQELAKLIAHTVVYSFCSVGCFLGFFVGEDLFRIMFVPGFSMALTLNVYFNKIEFLARHAYHRCISPPVRANIRAEALGYVEDKLGKVEKYVDDLQKLFPSHLRGLSNLHNWF